MNNKRESIFYLALSVFVISLLAGGSILFLGAPIFSDNLKAGKDSKTLDTNGVLMTAGNFEDDVISIDGNSALADNATSGSGTLNDPYLIEDLRIKPSSNNTPGISIKNTDAHFRIENVTVIDAIPESSFDVGGFYLDNITNGVLANCNAILSRYTRNPQP